MQQNLGAILRSCFFFGVEGVVLCARNSSPLSPIVAKASCGALEYLNLYCCHSMPRFLQVCSGLSLLFHSTHNCLGCVVFFLAGNSFCVVEYRRHECFEGLTKLEGPDSPAEWSTCFGCAWERRERTSKSRWAEVPSPGQARATTWPVIAWRVYRLAKCGDGTWCSSVQSPRID